MYVEDYNNQAISQVTPAGMVTTLAGSGAPGFADGPGSVALFFVPIGVAVDGAGNVYVADSENYKIRKATMSFTAPTVTTTARPCFSARCPAPGSRCMTPWAAR